MKTKEPFFSVIMPVYNREEFINESVSSVLNQSIADFELICIDDGSTDNSLLKLKEIAARDNRIVILEQANEGRCSARNKGLEFAKGKWICFLDSDDGYLQNHFSILHKLILQNPQWNAFATDQIIGNRLKEYKQSKCLLPECVLTMEDFLVSNPVSLNQFCFNSKKFAKVRFPNINILNSEDLLFMRIFSLSSSILKVNTITNYVNEHVGRSVNQSSTVEYVKWHQFAADYFINNYLHRRKDIRRIKSFTYLLLSNVFLSNKNKRDGLRLFLSALKYPHSLNNILFYKAIIKFIF